jgi:hypothetical protein
MNSLGAARPLPTSSFRALDRRRLGYFLQVLALCLLIASFFAQDAIAYLCVTIPVFLPVFLWMSSGAYGIPVLPVISALFYLFYAMPLLFGNTLAMYRQDDLVWAAMSVGLFLIAASLGTWPFLGVPRAQTAPLQRSRTLHYAQAFKRKTLSNLAANDELFRLICLGFGAGIIFYLSVISGTLGYLGTFLSVVRACVLPLTSVACYFTGYARGAGALTGQRWIVALGGFTAVTTMSFGSLFLVGGATNVAAGLLGYMLGSNRVPWRTVGVLFAVLVVLHAGKSAARTAYWERDSQSVRGSSITQLPAMLLEWFVAGITSLESPQRKAGPGLFERTSLLHMVLAVQEATPMVIPYLYGATYAYLPKMLTPRFMQPDKIESQAVLNLLSVRYGRERAEDTYKTTIGWGMVAEAYANYGNYAVLIVGVIFGVFCGLLMRLSAMASPLSLSMLITIAATFNLCNVESDFSYLTVTLFQTIVGIFVFAAMPRFVRSRQPAIVPYAPRN